MSADNWAVCPKCEEKAEIDRKNFEKKVEESYGKVPKNEYLNLVKELDKPIHQDTTLREDYEIGIVDGVFYVNYSAHCEVCDFSFKFKDRRVIV